MVAMVDQILTFAMVAIVSFWTYEAISQFAEIEKLTKFETAYYLFRKL
jgi:hypothetical protein